MNPEGGYARLYRRMWQNPAFRSKQEAAVFAWMISAAQWREHRMATRYGPVTLGVGELLIAERELANDFGLHRNTLRALLQRMADEGIIERFLDRTPHRAGTVVRIKNYVDYQCVADHKGLVQDRNRTGEQTEAGPQEDRIGTKNKEGNYLKEEEGLRPSPAAGGDGGGDLFGTPPRSGPPKRGRKPKAEPTPEAARNTEAVETLAAMTGKAPQWPLFQAWVRDCGGDAEAICGFIAQAAAQAHKDPIGFVTLCIQNRAKAAAEAEAPVPEEAGGWVVADVVAECDRRAKACFEGLFPGFSRLIANALASGADPPKHVYPVMDSIAGRAATVVQSLGFFRVAIWKAMNERRAA